LSWGTGKKLARLAILVAVAATVLWWGWGPLVRWYAIHRLAQANESQRSEWVQRVANLDTAAMSGLIDLLRRNDDKVCANSQAALSALEQRWGPADTRTARLAKDLASSFSSFSTPGREAVLEWFLALVHDLDDQKAMSPVVMDHCGDLAAQGLASKEPHICMAAIRLVRHAPPDAEKGLLDQVVPLLKAGAPEVRRTAVLALGLAEEMIGVEGLLPLLQDSDPEVRRLCEGALRGRGLQDAHIKLAKLITDERPGQRLQVVHHLNEAEDLDSGIWLMRLSQDSSPAVRAAAVRFAAENASAADFRERLLLMSREDPSPTVRQLAAFYLKSYQHRD